jgi:hypothetical protein
VEIDLWKKLKAPPGGSPVQKKSAAQNPLYEIAELKIIFEANLSGSGPVSSQEALNRVCKEKVGKLVMDVMRLLRGFKKKIIVADLLANVKSPRLQ